MSIALTKPTPFVPSADQDERRLPASYSNHRFVFVHYPTGRTFSEEHGFIPELSTIVAKPGVNGVGKDGRLNKPIAGSIQKGGIVINPNDARLGEWVNYVASYDTVNGKHWCFKAETFSILPGGRVAQGDNSAKFIAFRKQIDAAGMCHPMEEAVYNELREVERRACERLGKEAAKNPHMKAAYDARVGRMAAMDAAWRKLAGLDAPIPADAPMLTPTVADALDADELPPVVATPKRRVTVAPVSP